MAKRFTDTDKWKKVWFRELKPIHKCFWEYVRDNCNNAGVWDVDFKLASFQVGAKLDQNIVESVFEKQFVKINNSKWFIVDFIEVLSIVSFCKFMKLSSSYASHFITS